MVRETEHFADSFPEEYSVAARAFKTLAEELRKIKELPESFEESALTILHNPFFDFDERSGELIVGEKRTHVKPRLTQVIAYLMRNQDRMINREELLDNIWGEDTLVGVRCVDVYISHLRRKLEEIGVNGENVIVSRRGFGYQMQGFKNHVNGS